MRVDGIGAYGAGVQIHVEDLADHLAGRGRRDAEERWTELWPVYDEPATKIGLEALGTERGQRTG
jgi:hypothetical protein